MRAGIRASASVDTVGLMSLGTLRLGLTSSLALAKGRVRHGNEPAQHEERWKLHQHEGGGKRALIKPHRWWA